MTDNTSNSRKAKLEASPFNDSYQLLKDLQAFYSNYWKQFSQSTPDLLNNFTHIAEAFNEVMQQLIKDPAKLGEAQLELCQNYMLLWQKMGNFLVSGKLESVAQPSSSDRRFDHEDWNKKPIFDFIKQAYLISAQHILTVINGVKGLDEKTTKKVDFYARQFIDACAPTNFPLTNPEVLQETISTGGANLVKGFSNMIEDIQRGNGVWTIKMTDLDAFKVGVNIATTPGKVVFQNELFQLLQYTPTTKKVFKRPLLIISPWINKYYNLDLRPENSFIKWVVDQGHTVFVTSWVNPDSSMASTTFEDYMTKGSLIAFDAIEKATGEKDLNVIGYCIGGTLLGCTLAYMAKTKDTRVASATYLTSLLDFSDPGEMSVFIDQVQLKMLDKKMEEKGYLDGRILTATFNMLRSNDLIWTFYINNYLQGSDPVPFDLLFWNSDATNLPRAMHSFYLRNMYLENRLIQANAIKFNGVKLDIRQIKTPIFSLATERDHIAPWKTVYNGAKMHSGPVTFVLGGSGHIAGVINPPCKNKYDYRESKDMCETADEWYEKSTIHAGSWWTYWQEWIKQYAGDEVEPRVPGDGKLTIVEDAPGSYVRRSVEEINDSPKE